jgi:hypothetical protein
MDPQTRSAILTQQLGAKVRTVSEVRALDDLGPFTPADIAELELFANMGKPAPTTPTTPTAPNEGNPTNA